MRAFIIVLSMSIVLPAFSKNVIYRKKQNVSFDGASVDGVSRNPDGAYLMQKRGLKFIPLYKVKNKFDSEIKESVDYLR